MVVRPRIAFWRNQPNSDSLYLSRLIRMRLYNIFSSGFLSINSCGIPYLAVP